MPKCCCHSQRELESLSLLGLSLVRREPGAEGCLLGTEGAAGQLQLLVTPPTSLANLLLCFSIASFLMSNFSLTNVRRTQFMCVPKESHCADVDQRDCFCPRNAFATPTVSMQCGICVTWERPGQVLQTTDTVIHPYRSNCASAGWIYYWNNQTICEACLTSSLISMFPKFHFH